ncbi:MAG: HDOD domain-containing protein [Spirochaetes bacterium]|nr:HDOD domain-containing protein [Spirochaetota bacterium]
MIDQKSSVRLNRFIQNMPPLPITVSKILEITKNPNVSAQELNNIISIDPVLTGRILKLINSAYYSLPNQITSIVRAIVMLGINTVKNLALSTSIVNTINKKENFNALDMDGFWRHSICVGVLAKTFANRQGVTLKLQEEYFVAGLLHDIGKIPLNSQMPEKYLSAMTLSRQNKIPLIEAENRIFGLNHTNIGLTVSQQWRLNPSLVETICHHHDYMQANESLRRFVATITLANIITNKTGIGFSGNKFPENKETEIFEITKLSWDDIDNAETVAEEAIKKAEIFLHLT